MNHRFRFMELLEEPEPAAGSPNAFTGWLSTIPGKPINDIEVARAKERIRYFTDKGVRLEVAQWLVIRDRQQDDRRSCAECRHQEYGRCTVGHSAIGGFRITELFRCKRYEND
ncbi:MAG: hypothetical protein GX070_06665 [Alcaligenaceae bacterium]|nr:hypothetical protein [Alcaligenaceae bacterium]